MKLFNQNTFRSPFILQITAKTAKQPYILNALKVKWFLPGFNILRSACVKYTVCNGNTGSGISYQCILGISYHGLCLTW